MVALLTEQAGELVDATTLASEAETIAAFF